MAAAESPRQAASRPVSHGICRPCLDRQLSALDRPARPSGAWMARPVLAQAASA